MKLLIDIEGKINYDKITKHSTVQDLLEAIDIFLNDNTLSCDKCQDNCCKKTWSVEMDNVCVNRLCNWDKESARNFVQDKLLMKENMYREFDQYVLNKETNCNYISATNFCTIYDKRPIICRLYICSPKSYRYNVIRELISGAYLKALVMEEKMRNSHFTQRMDNQYGSNPAVFARNYNILLEDVLNYAQEEGWLDPEETQELYREL